MRMAGDPQGLTEGDSSRTGRDGAGRRFLSRATLLLASLLGATLIIFTWSTTLDYLRGENGQQNAQAESEVLAAARAGRDAIPRALEPADRALALLQQRAGALGRGDRREADVLEQTLSNLARRAQDGIRALAVTDAQGNVTWQAGSPMPGWLGNAENVLAHRYGRMAPVLSRPGASQAGLVISYPILGLGGRFDGVALALLEPTRLGQALPAAQGNGDPQTLLFHNDGSLLARGRNAQVTGELSRLDPGLMPEPAAGGVGERVLTRIFPGTDRRASYASAQVPGYDLIVLAMLEAPVGGAFSRGALVVIGLAGAITCFAVLGLLWVFGRAFRQTGRPDQALDEEAPNPAPMRQHAEHGRKPVIPARTAAALIEALPAGAYAARVLYSGGGAEVHITAVNPAIREITGWDPAHFQDSEQWNRSIDWSSYPAGEPLLERLADSAGTAEEAIVEYRLRRPDGSWMWLRDVARIVARHGTTVDLLGCLTDVTRERELSAQADSASRVAARGAMAAGLAHELNQPLAVMSLAAENALDALEEGAAGIPEALARLRRIATQAERAKAIAAQLRSFARLEAAVLEPVSLPHAVQGALSLVSGNLKDANVEVEVKLPPSLPAVRGQKVLVEQVLMNLCLNAKDAMLSREGVAHRLIITAEPGFEPHEIRLIIRDTGTGLPPEVLERVFDPFFSTKPATKGTGLGLPLCRSIMLRFGGGISLDNRPGGGGAEAILTFQRARPPSSETPEPSPILRTVK
ncbi:PAS domain-containing sensor histidine kinase [Rhodovarius crocodyli]|uniref:histidine kinase n=1 Tax=Rhodovarius crocodyli TaxID=1979269 RepID=A0A437MFF7_9PROT|nr:ATP-binding protein [Rhodovarius crocodyli]RVT96360.1 PAS domain-containing sensor histidine kinase [Rhodovarius crocodyli]